MIDMGREMGFSYQHISIVMKQWEKEGLVIKAQVEERKVQVSVEITEKGKAIVNSLRRIESLMNEDIKINIRR